MNKVTFTLAVCAAFVLGMMLPHARFSAAAAAGAGPTQGWNLHIDAEKHFGNAHPSEIAHHWCKPVSNGLTECQIYSSDAPDAQLVAVETIVQPATYKAFPAREQAMWHYHKDEIPKVNAKLPDVSPSEAKKIVESISDTYGKVWVLYDPMATNGMPTGQPSVTILK